MHIKDDGVDLTAGIPVEAKSTAADGQVVIFEAVRRPDTGGLLPGAAISAWLQGHGIGARDGQGAKRGRDIAS